MTTEVERFDFIADDGRTLSAGDLRSVLGETEDFLSSERHGLERLFDIIQSRNLP